MQKLYIFFFPLICQNSNFQHFFIIHENLYLNDNLFCYGNDLYGLSYILKCFPYANWNSETNELIIMNKINLLIVYDIYTSVLRNLLHLEFLLKYPQLLVSMAYDYIFAC